MHSLRRLSLVCRQTTTRPCRGRCPGYNDGAVPREPSRMDFRLSAEHEMVVRMVRDFVQKEVAPTIRDWDRKQEMAPHILPRMGELGILGICLPERYGGQGFDYLTLGLVCEELEAVDTTLRVVMSVHMGLNSMALLQWGTEEQRQAFLVPQAKGERAGGLRADRARRRFRRGRHGLDGAPRRGRLHPQRREDVDLAGDEGPPHPVVRRARTPRRPIRTTGLSAFMLETDLPGVTSRRHPRQARRARRLDRLGELPGRARAGRATASARRARASASPCRAWTTAATPWPPAPPV